MDFAVLAVVEPVVVICFGAVAGNTSLADAEPQGRHTLLSFETGGSVCGPFQSV